MKINFKTVKQFIALSILMKSIVACSSDDLSTGENPTIRITKGDVGGQGITEIYTDSTKNGAILLSAEPLGNPYNVDTLKKAYALLYPNGNGQAGMPGFHPTHYQVRFLPADSVEFAALMASDLVLTTIPLDKKVTGEGTYYFDPVLEAQNAPYTWQYTIVPATEQLPNMRHEITAEICAPNDGSKGRSVDGLSNIWPALEAKAYEMCGEEIPSKVESRGAVGDVGIPGATGKYVYVWDDKARQYIPAKGAKVVAFANTWGASAYTNDKGGYGDGVFSSVPVSQITRLEIRWEGRNDEWRIFDGTGENDIRNQAIYICPYGLNQWTFRIKGGKQQTFASATRALHRLYQEGGGFLLSGLMMPYKQYLKVVCIDGSHAKYAGCYFPDKNTINIWAKGVGGDFNGTDDIFRTTAHELGHMQHYMCLISDKKNWNRTENIIIESWACFIAWLVSESDYNELGYDLGRSELLSFDYDISFPDASGQPGMPGKPIKMNTYHATTLLNRQGWPHFLPDGSLKEITPYSPLFIDLVDNDNQRIYMRDYYAYIKQPRTEYKKYPDDLVSNSSFYNLQQSVRNATTLNHLKEYFRSTASDSRKIEIDTLFNKYIYYWSKYK